jgi:hypothetical protein
VSPDAPPAAARALLAGLVDYAGLFPPAALSMQAAAAEYARWRGTPERFMLGRFVVPAPRLDELARAAAALGDGEPWRLSALFGKEPLADAALVAAFDAAWHARFVVDAVELKAASAAEAEAALDVLPGNVTPYVELPLEPPPDALALLRRRGARAKLRTGGVVPEAIPAPAGVAGFIAACVAAGVPFKATAGLHHPLRAERALSYEPDSPRASMHGFLNVFAAAVFARVGASAAELEALLLEEATVAAARREFATSFGSCSFAEPVADLQELGLLTAVDAQAVPGRVP